MSATVVSKTPRMVVLAFAGSDNLGDKCILESEIAAIRSRWPSAYIAAQAVDAQRINSLADRAIPQRRHWELAREISCADVVILGGGGIIQDDTSALNLLHYLAPAWMAARKHVPLVSYGLGVGPIHRAYCRRLAARALQTAKLLCVRDAESASLLERIGVRAAIIKVTADPVLNYQPASYSRKSFDRTSPCVAVALRAYTRGKGWLPASFYYKRVSESSSLVADLLNKVVPALRWLKESLGAKFAFIPFQGVRDERILRFVASAAGLASEAIFLPTDVTPREAYEWISRSHLVLGMRLHACIIAARQSTPFVALSYSPKVRSFADSLGLARIVCDFATCTAETVLETTRQTWYDRTSITAQLEKIIPEKQRLEQGNLEAIAFVLHSCPRRAGMPVNDIDPASVSRSHGE